MFSCAAPPAGRAVVPAAASRSAGHRGRLPTRDTTVHVVCAATSRPGRGDEKRESGRRPRSTSPRAPDARPVSGQKKIPSSAESSSRDRVKAKALRTNSTVASAAVLEAARPAPTAPELGWPVVALPATATTPNKKRSGNGTPARLQVVRETVPLQQRKAPSTPTSAAAAAYLVMGQASSTPKKTKVSLVRRTGVEQVQAPSRSSGAAAAQAPAPKQQQQQQKSNPLPPASSKRLLLESSNVVSTIVEERNMLERSWRISEAERDLRASSSQEASSTATPPPSSPDSRAWGGRKTPFVKPKRGGAVVRGRRVQLRSASKKGSSQLPDVPEETGMGASVPCVCGELMEAKNKVAELKRRAGNLRSRTVGRDGVEALGTRLLLSRDEEGFLLRLVQRKLQLDKTAEEMKKDSDCGKEPSGKVLAAAAGLKGGLEELHLLRSLAGDAREVMERCNIRLVVSIARKYHGQRDMDFRDLIQAGLTGLHKAFDRFDTEKGVKFSTYGHWWVRQGISRCLSKESRVVRLPGHVVDNLSRIYKTTARLAAASDNGADPPVEEVAAALDMTVDKVQKLLQFGQEPSSMEGLAFNNQNDKQGDEAMQLMDTLSREDDENGLASSSSWVSGEEEQDREAVEEAVQELVDRMLRELSPRERNIIKMRYGLSHSDGREQTFKEIGSAYGRTQERIRQVEDRAVRRLRRDHTKELGVLASLNLLPF